MWGAITIGIFTTAALGTLATDLSHTARVKLEAFEYARRLVNGKGIINLGSGMRRTPTAWAIAHSPEIVANVDITQNGTPRYVQWDLEQRLPFPDKSFDVAFGSHVLEHLENWQDALCEMFRVADNVVLVLPHPLSPAGLLHPGHRQHFTANDMAWLEEQCLNLRVFY